MTLLLLSRGHRVSGLALDPAERSLFKRAGLADQLVSDFRVDIRDAEATAAAVSTAAPDVVVHMAAQSLVRESYRDPRYTYETNAIGTLNVLEAVAATPSVRAHVVVTTDKVYRNVDQEAGYVETDPLGGDDPYSASKAMADLLAQSWIRSFPGCPTAIARAGNVIGGGDVSRDRLLPDLVAAYAHGQAPRLRFPRAVRPWQHVLDCLNGYLTLADALLAGSGPGQWNFGPGRDSFVEVGQVATLAAELWGGGAHWELDVRRPPARGEPACPRRLEGAARTGLAQSARLPRCPGMDDRLGAARARGRRRAYGDPGADRRIRKPRMSEFDLPPESAPPGPLIRLVHDQRMAFLVVGAINTRRRVRDLRRLLGERGPLRRPPVRQGRRVAGDPRHHACAGRAVRLRDASAVRVPRPGPRAA